MVYEIFEILQIQTRIVFAETIQGNTAVSINERNNFPLLPASYCRI